ncbi:MAG: hypothetical protein DMG64_11790 [Acidobacteria bacterium]|nr:MAG: hypothetical protein DMG64_11790 [Acidobacteriota bacterium]PYY24981.1 MAG: hypothetical protein DMG62_00390 [Acidobacteriota bacterium]
MEFAILIVLCVILLQASFLAIAPRTYLRIRNWIVRTPNRVPVNRGYGRERAVGLFVILIAGFIIYWIISSAFVDVP